MEPEQTSFWTANIPSSWPSVPTEMTITTLAEIEACPRRWALGAANYPGLWTGRGYPPRFQRSTLAGTVVHLVLEAITKGLVRAGCPSIQDPTAPQVMKDLGGYTKVVNDSIDQVLARLAHSPRAARILEFAARSLRAQVPDLRMRAQAMLCRMRLPQGTTAQGGGHVSKSRKRLNMGVFPEIEFRAPQIGWKGKADLLVISPAACEIADFKTGAKDEGHRFQLWVYALLWSLDVDLNPDHRLADRLILGYTGETVQVVVPTEAELAELERHLIARRAAAHQAVSEFPPEAKPGPENCKYCSVRQLCDKYWTTETQSRMAEQPGDQRFADFEVTVLRRHGPSSWDVAVTLSRDPLAGKPAMLRTGGGEVFPSGARLRILDAAVAVDIESEAQPTIITTGTLSETYAVV